MKIELKAHKDETGKIRTGLDELKIMKISTKEELKEIESELVILMENKRMERFKIEEIKELEIELKELKSELLFEELMLERIRLGRKMVSKLYY